MLQKGTATKELVWQQLCHMWLTTLRNSKNKDGEKTLNTVWLTKMVDQRNVSGFGLLCGQLIVLGPYMGLILYKNSSEPYVLDDMHLWILKLKPLCDLLGLHQLWMLGDPQQVKVSRFYHYECFHIHIFGLIKPQ